ncbi:MAG: orotate phosphoribosyltransferase [Dehalococcoidia bacterium]|nr:orotate phosphoribosyltransferase [Dehalococcoidia bacterium]
MFKASGAIKEGHFLLNSGLHSPVYWEKFRILQYPHYTSRLCQIIVEHFKGQKVDLVAGPATGGIILAFETARQMGVRSIFAERVRDVRIFRRDFEIAPGEHVLIVDDILTTGGSIRETIDAVDSLGGLVIGIGVLINRSPKEIDLGVPLFSCLNISTTVYLPEECPLCAANIPLLKPGGQS